LSERTEYLVIWGQLTAFETFDLDLYAVVDTEERVFPILRVALDQEGSRLGDGKNWDHLTFYKTLDNQYPSDQSYKFEEKIDKIKSVFIHTLESNDCLQELDEASSSNESDHVEDTLGSFFESGIVDSGEANWLKATRVPESDFVLSEDESSADSDTAESDTDDTENLDVIEVDGTIHDPQSLPRLSILTSVISGVLAEELTAGDEIRARIQGSEVKNLPDDLKDPKRDDRSVPFDAEVVHVKENPSQSDIRGNPSEYRGIVARLSNETVGIGYLKNDEEVQMMGDDQAFSRTEGRFFTDRELVGIVIALALFVYFFLV
jgi:hypothetical protein